MRLTVISFHLFSGEVNVQHDFENSDNVGGGLCTPREGSPPLQGTRDDDGDDEVLVPQNFQEPGFFWLERSCSSQWHGRSRPHLLDLV
jgi:hypothetical protein